MVPCTAIEECDSETSEGQATRTILRRKTSEPAIQPNRAVLVPTIATVRARSDERFEPA